jgi:hypothetical protein
MENLNSQAYLEKTKNQLLEILRGVKPPSQQIQTGQVESALHPPTTQFEDAAAAAEDPDVRMTDVGRKEHPAELATN